MMKKIIYNTLGSILIALLHAQFVLGKMCTKEEIVKEKSDSKSCAKCGSEMVLRKASKGKNAGNEFWGCRVCKH